MMMLKALILAAIAVSAQAQGSNSKCVISMVPSGSRRRTPRMNTSLRV
jgi:hypothetical protein